MDEFIKYLKSLGTLSDNSINDDISRMNSMKFRGIDYTKGEKYARQYLEDSDLSDSTVKSCLRLCRRYEEYKQICQHLSDENYAEAAADKSDTHKWSEEIHSIFYNSTISESTFNHYITII